MDTLSPEKKAQLHEVRDLMLEIYQTLVRMRYLKPEWIHEGPHNLDALQSLYESLNLDPSVIYLYSILPYVDNDGVERGAFFQGSYFADFRKEDDVRYGRDPLHYGDEDGEPPLKPWMTPLSRLGNHKSVIIYSAASHYIWIFDQESMGSTDHNLHSGAIIIHDDGDTGRGEGSREGTPTDSRVEADPVAVEHDEEGNSSQSEGDHSDRSDQEMEDTEVESVGDDDNDEMNDNEEDEEDWDEEDDDDFQDDGPNYDEGDGRPAPEVLRDIVKWYKELRETPAGSGVTEPEWDRDLVVPLYRKHGWPGDDFDGDAFEIDRIRGISTREIEKRARQPLERIENLKLRIPLEEERTEELRRSVEAETTVDDEWAVRGELWNQEKALEGMKEELKRTEDDVERLGLREQLLPPDEVPLLEMVTLHGHRQYLEEHSIPRLQDALAGRSKTYRSKAYLEAKIPYHRNRMALLQKAWDAAAADAERLGSGKVTSENGLRVLGQCGPDSLQLAIEHDLKKAQRKLSAFNEWLAGVPEEAAEARTIVETRIKNTEDQIDDYQRRLGLIAKSKESREQEE